MLLYLHDFNGVLRKNKHYYLYLIKLGKLTSLSSISMRSLKLNFLVITEGRYICILLMQKCAVCVEKSYSYIPYFFYWLIFYILLFLFYIHCVTQIWNQIIVLKNYSASLLWTKIVLGILRFHHLKVQIIFIFFYRCWVRRIRWSWD